MPQGILVDAEDAQVRARAADSRIDLGNLGIGVLGLKPRQGLGAPPFLCGNAAAQIGDADIAPRFEFSEEIGQTTAGRGFDGVAKGVVRGVVCTVGDERSN